MRRRITVRPAQADVMRRLQAEVDRALDRFSLAAEAILASDELHEGTVVGIDGDALLVEVADGTDR